MTKFPLTTQQYLKLIIIIETLKKNNTNIYLFLNNMNMNNFSIKNEKFHVMQ